MRTGHQSCPSAIRHRRPLLLNWRPDDGGDIVLIITLQVDAPPGQAIGIKEAVAEDLEKYGDVRVASVMEKLPEQMKIGGSYGS